VFAIKAAYGGGIKKRNQGRSKGERTTADRKRRKGGTLHSSSEESFGAESVDHDALMRQRGRRTVSEGKLGGLTETED